MAKELPYFKFEPGRWDSGSIQLCTFEEQGMFTNVCSLYWQRLGELPYALALRKACGGNESGLKSLIEHGVLKLSGDTIRIDFLDDQLAEFENTSKQNSENALSGWEKRKKNATALRPNSDRNAIREEERREEKRKEEDNTDCDFENLELQAAWNDWKKFRKEIRKKLNPSTIEKQKKFLGGRPVADAIGIINQSIFNGWTGLFELKNNNGNKRTTTEEKIRRADAVIPKGRDWGNF